MVELNRNGVLVNMELNKVFQMIKYKLSREWELIFENITNDQAELLYLSGMFSGAGIHALLIHGARKSIVFIKLFKKEEGKTEVLVVTGGSETLVGFDYGRYKKITDHVLHLFEDVSERDIGDMKYKFLTSDEAFDSAVEEHERGNPKEALVLYNRVTQLEPEREDVWYLKGITLVSLGEEKEALDCFERALKLDPGYQDATREIRKLKEKR